MFYLEKLDIKYMRDLEIMAENTRSLQLFMNLHILSIDNKDAYMAASHVGRCAGLCQIIKQIPYHLRKDSMIIPEELMKKHATTYNSLWDRMREGKLTEEFFDIILE